MEDPKHTLYSKVVDEKHEPTDDGKHYIIPKHTRYSLYIGDFDASGAELNDIYNKLRQDEEKTLELYIDSHGGLISEGQRLQNIISNYFTNTTTYLDNKGYSMGAMLFTFGTTRIVHPYSEIMFHTYSTGYYGKANELKDRTKHDDKILNKYFTDTLKPFFKKKELKELLKGKDFWFDAKEMLKRNIATHILIDGEVIEAKEYLKGK